MARKIRFTSARPDGDREHFVEEDDIRVVLRRLPEELYARLRAVHFNDQGWRRGTPPTLGYVTGARREIALVALPPRVSLSRWLDRRQSPAAFGAQRGTAWPRVAVRRFMLYEVFLHELGHLQMVDEKAKSDRRRYAGQTKAQEFADRWRAGLWNTPFDHPDPAHGPPASDELNAMA